MSTKLQFYADLADRQSRQVTGSREDWTGFLTTAGRLYKYPFDEQLMIYAQRPNATACAELETWNKPMNRFVRKGSKGIALIDQTGDKPRLRYVFDFADTVDGRYNARKPFVWELKPEHEQAVMEALDKAYDADDLMGWDADNGRALPGNDLGDYIYGLAQSLSARYYEDNSREINYSAEDSFLEDYDEFNISVAFKEALTVSAAYSMMTRCGIDPADYFEDEDFQPIFDFNTPASVRALGQAVSTISEEVLREIEVTIKKYERERSNEHGRDNLHPERRLSDTRHSDTGAGERTDQVRHDAEILSQGSPPDTLQRAGDDGEAVPSLPGGRGRGEREAGAYDEPASGTVRAAGQSDRPDGLGSAHEQPESPGRGSDFQRVDLQLEQDIEPEHTETPSPVDGVSASGDTITDEEIDIFLTSGSSVEDGKYRILSFFLHDHDTKEKAAFLKHEYGTGGRTGAIQDAAHSYADYNGKGLTLKKGSILDPDAELTLTWTNVANRIDRIIADGAYMTQNELDRLPRYENQMLGARIINFFSNLPDEIVRPVDLEGGIFGNYWDTATKIGDTLDNPETTAAILAAMRPVMANTPPADRYYETRKTAFDNLTAFENGTFTLFPNLLAVQMNFEAPNIETSLFSIPAETAAQLSLFPTEQEQITAIRSAEQLTLAPVPVTITQDDINNALINWNGDSDSILRVAEYMTVSGRSREAAAFLRNEYGKPEFTVTKDGAEPVTLPWHKVQRGIALLIEAEQFTVIEPEPVPVTEPEPFAEPEPEADVLPGLESEPVSPKPVFLPDKNAVYDLDLSLYNDGDILGYDKNGVEYSIMRMGEYNFINTTTKITPMGDILGVTGIPADILRQIRIANGQEAPEPEAAPASEQSKEISSYEQHLRAKERYPDYIVLTTAGDFNELHGGDALFAADAFGYTVAYRSENGQEIPLVGIPKHDADMLIARLNERGRDVVYVNAYGAMAEYPQDDYDFIRGQLQPDAPEPAPTAEKLFTEVSPSGAERTDYYLLQYPDGIDEGAVLSYETLALIKEKADNYVICAEACYLSESDMARFNIGFRKMPRDWNLLPEAVQEQIRALRPEYERQWRELSYLTEPPEQSAPGPAHDTEPQPITDVPPERRNFHITDDHLGEGGAKTKYGYNIAAIRTLQTIEAENRLATPDEQETLSRYVGWGGLPQAFDAEAQGWAKEYTELKSLLTPEEYDSARASTLNAHYTSPTVIKAMYETLERLGVKDGNILEPACGVGNFLGLLPDSMKNAKLYGVELDSVTGRIAKQLYQNADIQVTGFEKTTTPDAFFDVAVGNVPFGSYKLADKRYDKQNFLVHDYFFAKALDQVRPGGIVAFVTSKGTLDKQNSEVRRYLAQRAELLGAVRLPNTAFKANAGTEVTSDIIFLQKRDRLIDIQPDWVNTWHIEDDPSRAGSIIVNRYFADNPHMMLGTMTTETTQYGHDTTCKPIEGADLGEQLREALSHIQGQITEIELDDIDGIQDISIPADPSVRNFSYTVIDDTVYFRENSRMNPVDMPATTLERVKGMVELRDCVRELIDYQLHDYSDNYIMAKQSELNILYDRFTAKFGLISSGANSKAFSGDSAYYLLCSLEMLDENGNLERKSDMFSKRTIKQKTVITSVDTSAEALAVSIAQKARVDIEFMRELTGFTEDKIVSDLRGVIFLDFNAIGLTGSYTYRAADEFLSGNVREKLGKYQHFLDVLPKNDTFYDAVKYNVEALTAAQPKDLDASEIAVRLGSTWVEKKFIQDFMFELLQPSRYLRYELAVNYSEHTGEWNIAGKTKASYSDVLATVTYGTERVNAYKIIEETLNLKDVRVYDTKVIDGKETRVLNKKETTLAQQKQEAIKQAFKDWIFRDPERRQILVKQYNEQFNSIRTREYDGSHIEFTGISPEIDLKPHQRNAIARILYGGNTLLAHEVGAGKTFEMVGAAMESKRLGLCNKSLMAVPNHLTEQMASEFLRLYPSANILVATKKDFETKNRKKFCAKIATGDYDAVIIGHSQLEKIPLSKERQERLLNEQIDEITDGIEELKDNNGERFTIKQLEKTRKSLEARLEKLTDDSKKDSVVTFEQLGVDRLYVDESHAFKNLFLYTKMRNVAGLSTSEAQKSSDMFMKCRYMDELTGGKGVIFATGTPVTNSIAELYTVQRYLQYDTLAAKNLTHFDAWASTFGETQTNIELSPEGSGYRARTRFAKFTNLPELMSMFKEVADIKTADTLDLPRPKANFHTVVADPSDIQREMVQDLSARAKDVHDKKVDPTQDNMLKITSDGRKIGLDQRLMNPMLPDDENSKVNACMDNIFRIWGETAENRSTQICFCDFSTPNADGRFNVYDDIKAKLVAKGIPEHEVAFIHNANTEVQKKELFAKVRSGSIRVLFGSTFKCGAGTNVQDRLVAMHDLDCPWRPADLAQRAGRIVRQGNQNAEVDIYRYCTQATFDSYLFQTIEKKQNFISQIMTSKSPVRSCDDVDEDSLSYAEIKALCAGNPAIKEKMQLDIEVAKLKLLKADHQSQQYRLQDNLLTHFPKRIEESKGFIAGFQADISRLETHTHKSEEGISPMIIGDKTYTDRGEAGAALLTACKGITSTTPTKIGSYRGFDMLISFDSLNKQFNMAMKGAMTHTAYLGDDAFGNITRINNAFDKIPQRLQSVEAQLQTLYDQTENAKTELDKPFVFEAEFAEKSARLAELDTMLNMDEQSETPQIGDETAAKAEPVAASAKEKPSILEALKQGAEKSRQLFGSRPEPEKADKKSEISL